MDHVLFPPHLLVPEEWRLIHRHAQLGWELTTLKLPLPDPRLPAAHSTWMTCKKIPLTSMKQAADAVCCSSAYDKTEAATFEEVNWVQSNPIRCKTLTLDPLQVFSHEMRCACAQPHALLNP